MRAAFLDVAGEPLQLRETPTPRPGNGQLLVKLEACGVCHTDLHISKRGKPESCPSDTLILGHEGVGTVAELGGNVSAFSVGDRVGVPWLHNTCGRCDECLDGEEAFCQYQVANGFSVHGAFAEYAVVEAAFAVPLTLAMDAVATAPLMCAGVTAYGAVSKATLQPGMSCAVFGCGGLGLYAVQLAARAGARVVALDVSTAKLNAARALGAHNTLLVDDDTGAELQRLGGMDACINFAPTAATWTAMIAGVRPRGRIVAAALVSQPVPISQTWLASSGVTIMGTSVGTRLQMNKLLRMHADEPLHIQTTAIGLEDVNFALAELDAGRVNGRFVIRF